MTRAAAICVLTFVWGSTGFGQVAAVPGKWIGTWALNLEGSKLAQSGAASAPTGKTAGSRALQIAASFGSIKMSGYTVVSDFGLSGGRFVLPLDGRKTIFPGGLALSFNGTDNLSFDLTARVNNGKFGNHVWENHFAFSADGTKLTETKTHTERDVVPKGWDPTMGKVISTSTSVLVFDKLLFIPRAGPTTFRHI